MFEYLHKYICDSKEEQKESYSFYQISQEEIDEAEQRLGFVFPAQLRLFYEEVGYGFFYDNEGCFTDVLMKPSDVADYRLGEGNYEYAEERDFFSDEDLVFFEVDADVHIYLKISGKNSGCVYFGKRKIAKSIQEFIIKIYDKSNYFI